MKVKYRRRMLKKDSLKKNIMTPRLRKDLWVAWYDKIRLHKLVHEIIT